MFPALYQKLKSIITQLNQKFKFIETPTTGRPLKIKKEDALTLALYQHTSTRQTKKSVYEDFKEVLPCSYKTFVVALNNASEQSMRLLYIFMEMNKRNASLVKYTDATDIPVCLNKNATKHKTMKHYATWGHSGKGFYFGLKMTMTRDQEGRILGIRFSHGNGNDRDLFRKVNEHIDGIIVADAGYVSKELERDMYIEGKRWCLIKPLKTMKKLITDWQYELYNGRFQIEFDFRSLKLFHGLVTSLPRSTGGYIANYLHSLLSFVLA
jgi:hypothetical protein